MNKHDQKRKDDLVKSLRKVKEQAEEAALYLAANDRPVEQIYEVEDALEHVNIALERLGVEGGCESDVSNK